MQLIFLELKNKMQKELIDFFKTNQINPRKKWGQNFLIDFKIIADILSFLPQPNPQVIIEIGSGFGVLTKQLVKLKSKIISYEIDPFMVKHLEKTILEKNFILKNQDFLKSDLSQFKNVLIVGNIPYAITSSILWHLFKFKKYINEVILMVQKEVAERLVAKANSSNYSKLTVVANYLANVKYLKDVKKDAFWPIPKVDSALVFLNFKKEIDYFESQDFFDFIKCAFQYRRKTLINNLKTKYPIIKINQGLKILNLIKNVRAQELSIDMLFYIYNQVK